MNTISIYNILRYFTNVNILNENNENNMWISKISKSNNKKFDNVINENSFLLEINNKKYAFFYKDENYNSIILKDENNLFDFETIYINNEYENKNLLDFDFEDFIYDTNIERKYYLCLNNEFKLFVFQYEKNKERFYKFMEEYNIKSIILK